MKKLNSRGFAGLEVVLVLVVVAVIGGAGWFVLKSKDKTVNTTTQNTTASPQPDTSYKFKEFDAQFTRPQSLNGLAYKTVELQDENGRPEEVIYLYDSGLSKINKKCADAAFQKVDNDDTNFAALTRGEGTFKEEAFSTAALLKQFSGFYVTISYPNGSACAAENHNLLQQWSVAVIESQEEFEKAFRTTASEIK
ncbi:MAG TPA: hypothetical protein VJJ78_03770 [Candidatus Saccharimonadales bacterium]|nr:hypothetical protein [Candidatus Saccharimonadales bacterium]